MADTGADAEPRPDGAAGTPGPARRKLPIGIQTFREIREDGCYYVGKTAWARRLVDEGTHDFLSRPRRFGNSLFLETLNELFEDDEALFEGFHIHVSVVWADGESSVVACL